LLGAEAGVDVIGPMVLGMNKPVSVLQQGASVDSIVHMSAITAARAIQLAKHN
jgi:malate dehydrogenase (oxaloacetate-decarboxylating)(NADP+)